MKLKKAIQRAIVVKDKTDLDEASERFGARGQAQFYMEQNEESFFENNDGLLEKKLKAARKKNRKKVGSNSFSDMEIADNNFKQSLNKVNQISAGYLKTQEMNKEYLANYQFSEEDAVVVIGQDGLVANTAKYAKGRPIIAVNPDPDRHDGVLLPFNMHNYEAAIKAVKSGDFNYKMVTMAEVELNDGQKMLAFNDFFIGMSSHKSARYSISFGNDSENHSSSGIIVATGAGSTGWMSSLFNMAQGMHNQFGLGQRIKPKPKKRIMSKSSLDVMPARTLFEERKAPLLGLDMIDHTMPWDTNHLRFVVREPFRSQASQIELVAGDIYRGQTLILESNMPTGGVIFSDGVEEDFLQFNAGTIATIRVAKEQAMLVMP